MADGGVILADVGECRPTGRRLGGCQMYASHVIQHRLTGWPVGAPTPDFDFQRD
jgi:hypothetical protein